MKRVPLFLFLSVVFLSCLKEDGADLAKPSTFVRYFNGGHEEEAVDLLKTNDGGYVILANSTFVGGDDGTVEFTRVKVIKTDEYGNPEWQRLYPADLADATQSWRANGISLTAAGGYVIAGEDIQTEGTKFLVIVTNDAGEISQQATVELPTPNDEDVSGLAIAEKNGSYFILGRIDATVENMVVASLNPSNLSVTWSKTYGSGEASLINRIYIEDDNQIVWGGTVNREDRDDMRLVRAFPNSLTTEWDRNFGTTNFDEEANGICKVGFGFALVGTSNVSGNDDILFKQIARDGQELNSITFPVEINSANTQEDETGNAIAVAPGNGFIILGTAPTVGEDWGRGGDDFYLIKIDAFGNVEWTKMLGSQNDDEGVAVLPATGGGYVILGTVELANVGTIALIKTDANGNIN